MRPAALWVFVLAVQGAVTFSPRPSLQWGSQRVTDDEHLYDVPSGLLIGAGLSAAQAEGAWNVSGKSESIIDFLGHIPNGPYSTNTDVSTDHYHKFKEDLAFAKQMKMTSFRFSISWARILPTGDATKPNVEGVKFYNDYIDEIKKNGMEPMVTMYHFDHPMSIENSTGGWTQSPIVDKFVEYANFLFDTFGPKVKYWNPINEGNMYCHVMLQTLNQERVNYMENGFYKCLHHTILAHAKVYKIYKEKYYNSQKGLVGTSILIWPAEPATTNYEDVAAATIFNDVFGATSVHPLVFGDYPEQTRYFVDEASREQGLNTSKLPTFTDEEKENLLGGGPGSIKTDFIALNVYSAITVGYTTNGSRQTSGILGTVLTDLSFVDVLGTPVFGIIQPDLMKSSLLWAWNMYHLPIIIGETGFADTKQVGINDQARAAFHSVTLRSLVRTMNEYNIQVISYHVWALLDVWEFTAGYDSRCFGLIHVDFTDPARPRTPKASTEFFTQVGETGHIPYIAPPGALPSSAGTVSLERIVLASVLITVYKHVLK